jgi:NAD(P)-dependent dehydrogenase (short-subunit alcohol dehydrogenase family)
MANQLLSVLITGVSPKGIGSATVLNLASQNPGLLILASRTRSRVQEVADQVAEKYPDTRVEIVILDLGSQKSIRQAAADVAALTDKLDILINNAGIVVTSRQATPEGIEQQFGTNHIGPFLFTNLLLPLLRKAAESNPPGATRVVSLSSAGHRLSPIRFSDYNFEGKEVPPEEDHFKSLPGAFGKCAPDGYNGIVTYAQSKTANILFTVYLQKHLPKLGIAPYVLHPGSKKNRTWRTFRFWTSIADSFCSQPSKRTSAEIKTTN